MPQAIHYLRVASIPFITGCEFKVGFLLMSSLALIVNCYNGNEKQRESALRRTMEESIINVPEQYYTSGLKISVSFVSLYFIIIVQNVNKF